MVGRTGRTLLAEWRRILGDVERRLADVEETLACGGSDDDRRTRLGAGVGSHREMARRLRQVAPRMGPMEGHLTDQDRRRMHRVLRRARHVHRQLEVRWPAELPVN